VWVLLFREVVGLILPPHRRSKLSTNGQTEVPYTALDEYYRQSDWNVETGIPTRYKLEELDLSWVADQLKL